MTDRTQAKALEIAERELLRKGWKFGAKDIASTAALIIKEMQKALDND